MNLKAVPRMLHYETLEGPASNLNKPGLVIEAPGRLVCIVLDDFRIRCLKFPERDILRFEPLKYQGQMYPVGRHLDHLIRISQEKPATKEAKEWLLKVDPIKGKEVRVELDPSKTGGRGATIAEVCENLEVDPKKARKFLRRQGLNAPYEDLDLIWKLLNPVKEKLRRAT